MIMWKKIILALSKSVNSGQTVVPITNIKSNSPVNTLIPKITISCICPKEFLLKYLINESLLPNPTFGSNTITCTLAMAGGEVFKFEWRYTNNIKCDKYSVRQLNCRSP